MGMVGWGIGEVIIRKWEGLNILRLNSWMVYLYVDRILCEFEIMIKFKNL